MKKAIKELLTGIKDDAEYLLVKKSYNKECEIFAMLQQIYDEIERVTSEV